MSRLPPPNPLRAFEAAARSHGVPVPADDANAAAFIAALEQGAQRQEVAFDGGRLSWRRFGSGPPLVLLHGGHGRWLHWARNIWPWSARHTVWVPDLPGYGESDPPREPTFDALVGALQHTLDALVGAGTPIGLVGFSFGGLAAAALAARRGAVRQLALLGAVGHGGPRRPRGELRPWREAVARNDTPALADVMRHNLCVHMLHGQAAADALAQRIHTDACLRTRFHSKTISRAGGLGALLDRHPGALLLAWGEHDVTALPEEAAHGLAAGRPRCRTLIVPGAGHWVQYEAADTINRGLLAWLDEPDADGPA